MIRTEIDVPFSTLEQTSRLQLGSLCVQGIVKIERRTTILSTAYGGYSTSDQEKLESSINKERRKLEYSNCRYRSLTTTSIYLAN